MATPLVRKIACERAGPVPTPRSQVARPPAWLVGGGARPPYRQRGCSDPVGYDVSTRKGDRLKILLYSPDNGVTRNFMPHLWMFLLQSLTPPANEVVLIDGNARRIDEEGLQRFVRDRGSGLVGIGSMTG